MISTFIYSRNTYTALYITLCTLHTANSREQHSTAHSTHCLLHFQYGKLHITFYTLIIALCTLLTSQCSQQGSPFTLHTAHQPLNTSYCIVGSWRSLGLMDLWRNVFSSNGNKIWSFVYLRFPDMVPLCVYELR